MFGGSFLYNLFDLKEVITIKRLFIQKKTMSLVVAMFTFILLSACGTNGSGNTETTGGNEIIIIGTHPVGTPYNGAGTGIASLIDESTSVGVTVRPYDGTNAWMPFLNTGDIHLGVSSAPDLGWAMQGINGFRENKDARLLLNGRYIQANGIIVREDSGIKTTADLKGKKVASGYAGNQVIELLVGLHLQSVGLTWDDVERIPVSSALEGLEALREGRVDAAFGENPNSATALEVNSAAALRTLNIGDITPENFDTFPEEMLELLNSEVPGLRTAVVESLEGGERVLYEYPIVLAASAKLSDDAAYDIVKALWENYEKLNTMHIWLEGWNHDTMFNPTPPAPYHPGAIKFFTEKGLWTDEAEAHYQEMLKKVE